MPKEEATVDSILRYIGRKAELRLSQLGKAIEHRNLYALANLSRDAYEAVWLLRNIGEEFDLPEQWEPAIHELWKEMEILKQMAVELMRRSGFVPKS